MHVNAIVNYTSKCKPHMKFGKMLNQQITIIFAI